MIWRFLAKLMLTKEERELAELMAGRKVRVSIKSSGYCISEED
jgi:hypothetical protein